MRRKKQRRAKNGGINTRQRASGSWSFYFTAGRSLRGRNKVIERGGFPDERAAYEAGVAAYNDWRHGNIGLTSDKILVNDFVAQWLTEVKSAEVRLQTLETYSIKARAQLYPFFNGVVLQDVSPALVSRWVRHLYNAGLSKYYIAGCLGLLRQAMKYAVHPLQLLATNPARDIDIPRNAPVNLVKRTIIDAEQWQRLIRDTFPATSPLHVPLMLMYHTGMRVSETVGLTWDCVDLERGVIHVRQQVVNHRQYAELREPKTRGSVRDIQIGITLVAFLKQWRRRQVENELRVGQRYRCVCVDRDGKIAVTIKAGIVNGLTRLSPVCTYDDGRLVRRTIIVNRLHTQHLNAHSFRHTYATRCEEAGVSAKATAAQLGHANVAITQNLYTHATEKMQREAVFRLEGALTDQLPTDNSAEHEIISIGRKKL